MRRIGLGSPSKPSLCYPKYLKLVRIVLIKECHGDTHHALVVARYVFRLSNIDCIVVVKGLIFGRCIMPKQWNVIMALLVIKVSEPAHPFHANELPPLFIPPPTRRFQWIIVRDHKLAITRMDARPQPYLISHNIREHFFACYRIDIANDEKLLAVLHQQRHELPEFRKRRISANDITLL